ncbi:MAG: MCE family protein, partial [Phycisphaerae bacterium]|nr:MCE family protein [Phycisphaerae bacterium]
MSERRQNIAVGITVIVALLMICGMILIFAGLPQIFQGGYKLKILLPSTGGAREGDYVHLTGMRVGRITKVEFTNPGDPRDGITLTTRIRDNVLLPGNTNAYITQGIMGGAYIELYPEGPLRTDRLTGELMEFFPTDRVTTIEGIIKGSGLAAEFKPAMESLAKLADSINSLIEPPPQDEQLPTTQDGVPATAPAPRPAGLRETIENLNHTMDAVHKFAIEAEKAAKNIASAATTGEQRLNDVAAKMVDGAEKMSAFMTTINRIASNIETGDGTAGQLINDPALYNNLTEAT